MAAISTQHEWHTGDDVEVIDNLNGHASHVCFGRVVRTTKAVATTTISDATVAETSNTKQLSTPEFASTMQAITGAPVAPVSPPEPIKAKTPAKKRKAPQKKAAVAKKASKKAPAKAAKKKVAKNVVKKAATPEPNLTKALKVLLPKKKVPHPATTSTTTPTGIRANDPNVVDAISAVPVVPPQLYRVEFDFKKDGKIERRSKTFVSRVDAQRLNDQKQELGKNPALFPFGPSQLREPVKVSPTIVEFDFKKDGKIERRTETFTDSQEADNFFNTKKENGKNPKLAINYTYTRAPVHKPTLAEVFPVDINPNAIDPRKDPTRLQAAGDPTITKQIVEDPKADKKLRKQHRKGVLLWKFKDIKTIISAKWGKEDGWEHARWFLKFSDGTEDVFNNLTIMHTRENEEHHLRIGGTNFIDGLSNKDYEQVVAQCLIHARRAETGYSKMLKAFRGLESVGNEIDKKVTKKAQKEEVPLTPKQIELATKIAELANTLCCAPSMFFRLPSYQKKHWVGGADNIRQLDLDTHSIDETLCSIQIMQHATRLFNKMTPRLEIGGPQIGTPELSAAHERTKAQVVKAPKEKKEKVVKEATGKDKWNSRLGTQASEINAAIFAADHPKLITMKWLLGRIPKFNEHRLNTEFICLVKKGFLIKLGKGYCVPGDEEAANKDLAKLVQEKSSKPAKTKKVKPAAEQDESEDTFIVKYDFKKDGVVERRRKVFEDRREAKAFFKEKEVAGKNPKFIAT